MNPRDLVLDKFLNWTPMRTRVRRILDLGETYDATFTFFVTAGSVNDRNEDLLHDIVGRGHEIASHSYDHVPFAHIDRQTAEAQIRRSMEVLAPYARVRGFRAPYLRANEATYEACKRLGLAYVSSNTGTAVDRYGDMWSVPVTQPPDARIVRRVGSEAAGREMVEYAGVGEVLMFHPWRMGSEKYLEYLESMLDDDLRFGSILELLEDGNCCCVTFDLDFLEQRQVYAHTLRHIYRSPHNLRRFFERPEPIPDLPGLDS